MVTGPPLLIIFVASIVLLLALIIRFLVNPFLALLITAILTAFMVGMPMEIIGGTITEGFGRTLSSIGIVIGLGIVLGKVLVEAGATDQIAQKLLDVTGYERSPLAVNATGYLASIPVFMDAAFVIFIPLAKRISKITGRAWITYVTALSIGLLATHAMVIPTPGPLAVAANMELDIGLFLLYALVASIPASLVGGLLYGLWLGKRMTFIPNDALSEGKEESDVSGQSPSGRLSISVLLLPVLLILFGSIFGLLLPEGFWFRKVLSFLGDKNIALLLGVFVAIVTLRRHITKPTSQIVSEAAASAGLILLITGAGGSFGFVISTSGIGVYLVETLTNWNISPLVLGFILSTILRGAQGSTTVALVTTSAILGPTIAQAGISPLLIGLAVCAGGMGLSLPNDSGFWIVSRFADLSVNDTIKSWTVGATIAGVTAFLVVLLLSAFQDFLPGL